MPDAIHPQIKLLPNGPFVEIDWGSIFLGRDCHLAQHISELKNKAISNRHCCVKKEKEGHWTVEDLGSTNGTWIGGRKLEEKTKLASGAKFALGRAGPQFEFIVPGGDAAEKTILESDAVFEATQLESGPQGSADRPYKVGKTPEVRLRHDRTGQQFRAKGYTIVLGRNPGAAQILIRAEDEKQVSGRHAELQFRTGGGCVLRDLGSRNGTLLNNHTVTGEMPIRAGDRITLGGPVSVLVVEEFDA